MAKVRKGRRGFGQITPIPVGSLPRPLHRPRHGAAQCAEHLRDHHGRRGLARGRASPRRFRQVGVPHARAGKARTALAARKSRVFEDYANRWLDSLHDLRPTTRVSYRASLDNHLIPIVRGDAD